MFRFLLKQKLKALSKWAIKKHSMELIVVAGAYDTRIVKDLSYTLLHPKVNVRRLNTEPWWDFSIPLAILGYKDVKRSIPSWLFLLFRANIRLLLGKPNPQAMILNLNYTKDDTADFWTSFIEPDILVITHFNKELKILNNLINNTRKKKGKIIINSKDSKETSEILNNYPKLFKFGLKDADLIYETQSNHVVVLKKNSQRYELQTQFLPTVKPESIVAAISVALSKDIPLLEALYSLLKFEMPLKLVKNIKGILNT